MYQLKSPFIKFTQIFDTVYDARDFAKQVIAKNNAIKFISIVQGDEIITSIYKPGYRCYGFSMFNYLHKINVIQDYFIIKQHDIEKYFIKTKKQKL